ncbi:MAG TPA: glycoside hydrolase family 10 protein [Chroococcidiopsis sp.]
MYRWTKGRRSLGGMALLALGMAIALLLRWPTVAIAQTATAELRGVWLTNIDSEVLFSRDSLEQAIQRLHRLNFNTLYPTVWNGGYTLYPSAVAEQAIGTAVDPYPGLQGRDMLAEAVEFGHRKGMAVIPWFEFGLMAPAESALVERHPDWVTNRRDGSQIVLEGVLPRVWLNPIHPEVQQFLVDLISDAVDRYDIDGIQLDDHFGMPFELGYDPYTIQVYQQEHDGQLPPDDPTEPDWMRWRANKITGLMVKLFFAVKDKNPDCLISLSPNPRQFSYEQYLQDWLIWERLGYVEELIVQIYRTSIERFIYELSQPDLQLAKDHIPVGVGILTGLRARPVAIETIAEQVNTARDRQFAGVSFFFYETLGDRDDDFKALFSEPAPRPDIADY